MKKLFLLVSIFTLTSNAILNAQVTIGKNQAPNADAVLELSTSNNDKGFLPPRIALVAPHNPAPLSAHVEGMIVYNTTVLQDSLQKGLYINNGAQWLKLCQTPYLTPNWFYMPPFPNNVSNTGSFTVDLWQEYQRQFDDLAGGNITASDASIPRPLPKVYSANDFRYYVTGYDDTVFSSVQLTTDGKLSYTITPAGLANVSDSTFMNIVLVIK